MARNMNELATAWRTRRIAIEARNQTALLQQLVAAQTPQLPPAPGWYLMNGDPRGITRWWDGYQWTGWTRP